MRKRKGGLELEFLVTFLLLGLFTYALALTISPSPIGVKPQEVVEVLKTCPIPINPNDDKEIDLREVCSKPLLKKLTFVVKTTTTFVDYKGKKLRIIKIKPKHSLSKADNEAVCRAFKELQVEIEKKGGFAVVDCNSLTLNVGISADKVPNIPITKVYARSSSPIALFSLFSLF